MHSAPPRRIDSHQHFWRYDPLEYGWIDNSMRKIRRDFLPADLKVELDRAGVQAAISVQARETLEETRWLLDLAAAEAFLAGVVGWAPLCEPGIEGVLEELAAHPKLKAVRHVVQNEPNPEFLLRADFNRGVAALRRHGLIYDILIFERQLAQTIQFVDRHPDQIFVLDHIAKPRIAAGEVSPWRERLRELALRPHVYCKLSGIVTEADYMLWTPWEVDPYIDIALEAFGPERVMFGSDWPVCLVAVSYQAWFELVYAKIAQYSHTERERILGGTAAEAYRL